MKKIQKQIAKAAKKSNPIRLSHTDWKDLVKFANRS